jgi:hypothetical protein
MSDTVACAPAQREYKSMGSCDRAGESQRAGEIREEIEFIAPLSQLGGWVVDKVCTNNIRVSGLCAVLEP